MVFCLVGCSLETIYEDVIDSLAPCPFLVRWNYLFRLGATIACMTPMDGGDGISTTKRTLKVLVLPKYRDLLHRERRRFGLAFDISRLHSSTHECAVLV